MLLSDLLNLHAAGRRADHNGCAGRVVDHDADVDLTRDLDLLLDEHGIDGKPRGAGLLGDEPHSEHGGRGLGCRGPGGGELDASAAAAAAGVRLCLHHDGPAEFSGGRFALLGRPDHPPGRYGYTPRREDSLRLVFVELHRPPLAPASPRDSRRAS